MGLNRYIVIPGVTGKYSRQTEARRRRARSGLFLNSSFRGTSSRSPGAEDEEKNFPRAKWDRRVLGKCDLFKPMFKVSVLIEM